MGFWEAIFCLLRMCFHRGGAEGAEERGGGVSVAQGLLNLANRFCEGGAGAGFQALEELDPGTPGVGEGRARGQEVFGSRETPLHFLEIVRHFQERLRRAAGGVVLRGVLTGEAEAFAVDQKLPF